MRIFKALIVFALFTNFSFAQENTTVEGNKVTQKEVAPIWPGCEDSESTKECFNTKMNSFIKENFSYSQNDAGEWVRGKSTVSFTVDDTGKVTNVETEGPEPIVNKEVERVVRSFPKLKPGMRGENPVAINYQMSFNF
ncbi:energy transducer TonB [Antarcticibacterium flavum]|uniref:Energy transducer TonB n=1 Tax=Antarcticibacterium flavum TaxID=2058175 RepID=A0A5B7X1F9_9FLAO|nr:MULTISPECIES: energy transducer TonB [Antarcticibacterium]MCM4160920.1 energy transducer TonB [Antarcticibacterium sp. W02-3]QCY68965.1 energy transducer TonB [Antarcticibacterium flavum]